MAGTMSVRLRKGLIAIADLSPRTERHGRAEAERPADDGNGGDAFVSRPAELRSGLALL